MRCLRHCHQPPGDGIVPLDERRQLRREQLPLFDDHPPVDHGKGHVLRLAEDRRR